MSGSHEAFEDEKRAGTAGSTRGWQPHPTRDGYEQWWDGQAFTPHTHRSPRPGAAFDPNWKRAFWPGPNTHARLARYGLALTVVTFLAQSFVVTAEVLGLGVVGIPTVMTLIIIAAVTAGTTALLGYRGMQRADRDGGRASAVASLTVAAVLGATPVSFLLAYAIMGFRVY